MTSRYYMGFDIHTKVISFCVKKKGGEIVEQGTISGTREALTTLVESRKGPWKPHSLPVAESFFGYPEEQACPSRR